MLFRKKKNYEMNIDTANTILQNVFAAESKAPNTIPFDKLILREKANTRFYDRGLILLLLVLLLTFISPLTIIPIVGISSTGFTADSAKLKDDYVEDGILYLQLEGINIQYEEAFLETTDGVKHPPVSFDKSKGIICFHYIDSMESNIYIPIADEQSLHLLLTPH